VKSNCKITISAQAWSDYDQIFDLIAQDDLQTAVNFTAKILERINTLHHAPFVGEEDKLNDCRRLVETPYLIYYDMHEQEQSIDVLHIRHGARKPFRRFQPHHT